MIDFKLVLKSLIVLVSSKKADILCRSDVSLRVIKHLKALRPRWLIRRIRAVDNHNPETLISVILVINIAGEVFVLVQVLRFLNNFFYTLTEFVRY